MDFDDGNWQYRGAISVNGKAVYSPWRFSKKTIAIEATFKDAKPNWYKSGYVVFESNGLQIPKTEPMSFGRSVVTAPDYPEGDSYRIKFNPVRWLGSGRLRFWEFIPTRKTIRPEPINPDEFTTQEIDLLQSSGLDPAKLRLSAESLEVVLPLLISLRSADDDSISTLLKTLTSEIREMANTDIRSMLAAVEAATAQSTINAANIASQGVTLADVKATAVVEKNFTLQKVAFVLEGDVYRAPIQHDMGSRFPGVTIYDNDGDLQLAEFIALSETLCKLELTASQWADNSFPLTVNLQARNGVMVAQPTGMSSYAVPFNPPFIVRYNPLNRDGTIERSDNNGQSWFAVNDGEGVESGKIAPDGQIHVKLKSGIYLYTQVINGSWQNSSAENYDSLTVANGAIVL